MASPGPHPARVVYSTAAAEAIVEFIARYYSVKEPLECSFLNRGFNDSFLVRTSDGGKYSVRLSRSGRRSEDDPNVAAETSFIAYLDRSGIPVATPVSARDGRLFTTISMPEGLCFVAMFRFLEGRSPRHDDPVDAGLQGQTLARIHLAAAAFKMGAADSQRTDLDTLLSRPLKSILTLSTLEPQTRNYLVELADRLKAGVEARNGLSLITCHGDCHGGNARIVKSRSGGEEAAFFDFDEGGFGYLSYDLAVYLWANAAFGRKFYHLWHGFIDGYRAVRPVAPADLEAVRLFVPIRHIWLMGAYASRVSEWGTEALPASWLNKQTDFLREWEEEKLSPALF